MGTFFGHFLPGSFFIAFALWWTVQIFVRYYKSLSKGGTSFTNTATFPCSCLCGRLKTWEVEGFVKILFAAIGLTGEIITAFHDGKFMYFGNGQHATMFFFFGMSGAVDILVHHKVPLPRGTEYIMLALAFMVEAVLFMYHLHGRTEMDITIHTLLLYVVYFCILSILLELKFRRNVLMGLVRAYFVFLQGTWFVQVGFILYNPIPGREPWDETDHNHMMVLCMMFTWHMGGISFFMIAVGGIIGCMYRRQSQVDRGEYGTLQMQRLIRKDRKGQTVIDLQSDSDEIEYERPVGNSH